MTEEGAPEAARETEAAADAISEPPEPGLDVGGDAGAAGGASGASARAAGAPPPAPAAAVGTGRAGDGDPDATEAALAAAWGAAAAAGATVGDEEAFPKSMTIAERLKKEPGLDIEGKKVGIPNLIIMGKLVVYNKSVLNDDEEATVGEMYPIFMGLPAVLEEIRGKIRELRIKPAFLRCLGPYVTKEELESTYQKPSP